MREIEGDFWDFHGRGHYIVITTNGDVRKDGCCVMGRGTAWQAKQRFTYLPKELGDRIKKDGNNVHIFYQHRIISFPVKHHWGDNADPKLIEKSCLQLAAFEDPFTGDPTRAGIYMPRPGCGNGQLDWMMVRPILADILDDRFTIVERNP